MFIGRRLVDGNTSGVSYQPSAFSKTRSFVLGSTSGGDGFHLNRFGGDAGNNRVGRNVLRGDAHRAYETVLAHFYARHHGGVISDAGLGADLRARVLDDHSVIEVVIMRVDVGVIGNRAALVDDELAAVV